MNPFKRPQPDSGPTIYRPSEAAAEPHPRQYRTLAVEPAQAPALLPELSLLTKVNQRRGTILNTENREGYLIATAEVPLNNMFGYSTDLRSATQGKGEFTMEFSKYMPVPKNEQDAMMKAYREKLAADKK